MTYEYINLDYLKLMSADDADMQKMLLEMMFEEPMAEVKRMREMAAEKDYDTVHRISHKLKTTFPYIGNEELTQTNVDLEQDTKEVPDAAKVRERIDRIEYLLGQAIPELRQAHAALG